MTMQDQLHRYLEQAEREMLANERALGEYHQLLLDEKQP